MLRDEKWIEVPKLTPEVVFITGDPYATMTREGGGHTVYIMEEETPVPPLLARMTSVHPVKMKTADTTSPLHPDRVIERLNELFPPAK